MYAYNKAYLDEIVENQGKLFDFIAIQHPDKDTEQFIQTYMKSKTRQSIDTAHAYTCTMDYKDLWEYFCKTEKFTLQSGHAMQGFMPDWTGEFYAYYQWYYNIPSSIIIDKIPIKYLKTHYAGLHDLDLELAVRKVGQIQ